MTCCVIDHSGNFGNTIDGQALPGEVVDEVRRNGENPFIHPLTPPVKPVTNDRQYYHIPWEDSKPCTHIKFTWQDHRRRLYNSNVLLKICERLVGSLFQSLKLTFYVPRVTKVNFLLTISKRHLEKMLWKLMKWSSDEKSFDQQTNSLN